MDQKTSERLDQIFSGLATLEPSEKFCLKFSENLRREALAKDLAGGLTGIEPTAAFDAEFKAMLAQAAAEKETENILAKAARVAEGVFTFELIPARVVRTAVLASMAFVLAGAVMISSLRQDSPVLSVQNGTAMVKRSNGNSWTVVHENMHFNKGDTLRVDRGSTMDIAVPGKYAIRMKAGSEIMIKDLPARKFKGKAEYELMSGQVLIDIEKGFAGSKFFINTNSAKTTALGTKFSVGLDANDTTGVKVLEGTVKVESAASEKDAEGAIVLVKAGQKTDVPQNSAPLLPKRMAEQDWRDVEELYQIGSKAQVVLLLANTPERTAGLLKPCAIYISDAKPREIPRAIDAALGKIYKAVKSGKKEDHLAAIKTLEGLLKKYPNPKYDIQFMLYIGAYYRYIGMYDESVAAFDKVSSQYPDSSLASMAECAIGYIYENDIKDDGKARQAYQKVLKNYPYSLEAIWLEKKLSSADLA